MDYLWLKLSWRDPQCIWRHLPFGLSPTLTFEFKMPFISVFGLALVFRGGGPGLRRLVSRRKARGICYPLRGTGTCGAALPLSESLTGWVRALTSSRSGGRARAARTPETPRWRGVRTDPKALARAGLPLPALSAWTTRPTSPARPTRPSHSAGERVLGEAAAAVAAQR